MDTLRTPVAASLAAASLAVLLAGCAGPQPIRLGTWGEVQALRVDGAEMDAAAFKVDCERAERQLVVVPAPAPTGGAATATPGPDAESFSLVVHFDELGEIETFAAFLEPEAPQLAWQRGDAGPAPLMADDGAGGFMLAGWLERTDGEPVSVAVLGSCPGGVGPSAAPTG